jgi:hypothetical protein
MLAGRPVVEESTAPELTERQQNAIKTWRYLRIAMVALVIGLGVSILIEWWRVDRDCFQESISAYYYTPVHNYFVAVLLSLGVCLFCLKGSEDLEDTFLNLAGMFAPIVALVPTPDAGSCASIFVTDSVLDRNIENNVNALLAVGGVGLLVLAGFAVWRRPSTHEAVGGGLAALVWLATALTFWLDEDLFVRNAHYTAAVLMFICIVVVVGLNAVGYKASATSPRNPYTATGVAMVGSSVGIGIAAALGWAHWVLAIECALIVLFAVFWVIQTRELWREGLRPPASTG